MTCRVRKLLPHPDVLSHYFVDFSTCFIQISFLHKRHPDAIVKANGLQHEVGSVVCIQGLCKLVQFLEVIFHLLGRSFAHLPLFFVQHSPFQLCIGPRREIQDSLAFFHGLFAIRFPPTFSFVLGQLHQHVYFEGRTFQCVWCAVGGPFCVFECRTQEQLSIFRECVSIVASCKSSPFQEELPGLRKCVPHCFGVLIGQSAVHPTSEVVRQRQMHGHGVHRWIADLSCKRRATLHGRAHPERTAQPRSLFRATFSTHAAAFFLHERLHSTSIHGGKRAGAATFTPS
mmetsp:Transcript_3311/g.11795  ORF Transcript_3311/g.11795 Transcript_3311/m.11795 type:complete len:286 (-) Transcript_3311:36-893(-)